MCVYILSFDKKSNTQNKLQKNNYGDYTTQNPFEDKRIIDQKILGLNVQHFVQSEISCARFLVVKELPGFMDSNFFARFVKEVYLAANFQMYFDLLAHY